MNAVGGAPPERCDVAVIGAGIVGLAAARELALPHPRATIAVVDKEQREVDSAAAGVAALHSPHTGIVDFTAVACT